MVARAGFIHGTGAALNVSLGWIPDYVEVTNLTDGDIVQRGWLGKVVVFTSGGTDTLLEGDTLTGATSGATFKVKQIILDSGSWAGGDAAGWLIVDNIVGTIQSENADQSGSSTQSNIATVVVEVEFGIDIDTSVAAVTGNAGFLQYAGTVNYSPGFTIGSTISENGKLLGFLAVKNDPGESQGVTVAGNDQQTVW